MGKTINSLNIEKMAQEKLRKLEWSMVRCTKNGLREGLFSCNSESTVHIHALRRQHGVVIPALILRRDVATSQGYNKKEMRKKMIKYNKNALYILKCNPNMDLFILSIV